MSGFVGFEDMDEEPKVGKAPTEKQKFACEGCGGSGKVYKTYGYTPMTARKYEKTCPACKGKGHFVTSAAFRKDAAKKRKQKKIDLMEAFKEEHAEVYKYMVEWASWNNFASSLLDQFNQRGTLSDRQIAAFKSSIEKVNRKKEEKKEKAAANNVAVDLSPIKNMFDSAVGKGLKRPTYRALGLVLSRAPDHGSNPGAIYVKEDGVYMGKVANGEFKAVYACTEEAKENLLKIAANPHEEAVKYGRKTGQCSCCGRTLTKKISIEAGIGPICAENFGW